MKKKELILTYTLLAVMCIGVIIGSLLGEIGDIIATITTAITAIISAIAVYVQMKKDKDIAQAEFLLEFSKFFYTFEGAQKLESKVDRAMEKNSMYKWNKDDYELVYDYMLWLEALASMVINKTLTLKLINNIYNYRFFAIVNNPTIQKNEIAKFPTFYKNVFKLHKLWSDYRKTEGQDILLEKYDLSKLQMYDQIVKGK